MTISFEFPEGTGDDDGVELKAVQLMPLTDADMRQQLEVGEDWVVLKLSRRLTYFEARQVGERADAMSGPFLRLKGALLGDTAEQIAARAAQIVRAIAQDGATDARRAAERLAIVNERVEAANEVLRRAT